MGIFLTRADPSPEVKQATGVTRYNKLLKLVRQIVEGNTKVTALVEKEVAAIPKLVRESLNATAAEAGNVTAPMVLAQLERVTEHIQEVVRNEVAAAVRDIQKELPAPAGAAATTAVPSLNLNRGNAGT